VLAHPRRVAWFFNTRDGATGLLAPPELPFGMRMVAVPSITTTAGAGTNEDKLYIVAAPELPLFMGPLHVRVWPEVGSANGLVRIGSFLHAATLPTRKPEAIGIVSGTGLAGVSFA
jgi:hypothetical protein